MNQLPYCRHAGDDRQLDLFELSGFQVALAIASLPGMTISILVRASVSGD
jgi:hypothetical protein